MELRISIKQAIVGTALAAAALGFSTSANATLLACPSNIADNVTGTTDCEYSTTADQDFLNTTPITVNQEGFFGITDWTFITKTDLNGDNNTSGSWSLASNIWDLYEQIMLIFKDGNNTTLVGYLLDDGVTSGTWTTPFENPPFDVMNPRNVSHISYYGTPTMTSVPEPAALALLAAGLLGFGLSRGRARG